MLVLIFAFRLSDAAERNTLTVDEPHYVGVGLHLWQSGDYHYFETLSFHPPLTHHLAALPLLAVDLGERPVSRQMGAELLSGPDPDPRNLRWLLRMPFIALACWGALLLFSWAREVAGPMAGLLAVCLYTFSPTILANGSLIHSDITVTVFFLQTLYTFWRWWSRPGTFRFFLCGISLGLALLSKLSALILLPSLGLLLLAMEVRSWPLAGASRGGAEANRISLGSLLAPGLRAAALLSGLILIAVGVIWVGYGFSFAFNEGLGGAYAGVELPSIVHALLFDVGANTRGRGIYFMGEITQEGGLWFLLPVAWALKTPLALLLLLALAVATPRARATHSAAFGGRHEGVDPQRAALFVVVLAAMVYLAVVVFWLPGWPSPRQSGWPRPLAFDALRWRRSWVGWWWRAPGHIPTTSLSSISWPEALPVHIGSWWIRTSIGARISGPWQKKWPNAGIRLSGSLISAPNRRSATG